MAGARSSVKTAAYEHEKLAQNLNEILPDHLEDYREMARTITVSFCILAAIIACTCLVVVANQMSSREKN
jgi:hypothetical protein